MYIAYSPSIVTSSQVFIAARQFIAKTNIKLNKL